MQNTSYFPLQGFRVLDMSRILAGPWAGQLLADLGAEVIKVERPDTGDDTRHWGPPFFKDRLGNITEESAYFLAANRGKKSITVDISAPDGQRIVKDLAKESDVLIENYKVGGLSKYGLNYECLKAVNPQLIYCSITGFGQTGPYAHRSGYDFLVQAMGGLMSITGQPDDHPGGGPVKVGVAITDLVTGLYATIAIQSALLERSKSGLGQQIDLSLLDSSVAILANQAANYLVGQSVPERLGNAHPNIVPYQAFKTADGYVIIAVGNDRQFYNFCHLLNIVDLASDSRAKTNPDRVKNRSFIIEQLEPLVADWQTSSLLKACEKHGVPCGPINSIDQTFNDPGILDRGMRLSMNHPLGLLELPGNPIHFSRNSLSQHVPPPLLGQHTQEVLSSLLNYSDRKIEALKASAVI